MKQRTGIGVFVRRICRAAGLTGSASFPVQTIFQANQRFAIFAVTAQRQVDHHGHFLLGRRSLANQFQFGFVDRFHFRLRRARWQFLNNIQIDRLTRLSFTS